MELGEEFYTLTDEDGNEYQFEMIGHCELNGTVYYAFAPADGDADDDGFCEYTILKEVIGEDGEAEWVSIDDDDEFDVVADYFDNLFSEEIDYDATEDDKK